MPEPSDFSDKLIDYSTEVMGGRIVVISRSGGDLRLDAYNMGSGRRRGGRGWIMFEDAGEIESVDNRAPEAECSLQPGMIISELE